MSTRENYMDGPAFFDKNYRRRHKFDILVEPRIVVCGRILCSDESSGVVWTDNLFSWIAEFEKLSAWTHICGRMYTASAQEASKLGETVEREFSPFHPAAPSGSPDMTPRRRRIRDSSFSLAAITGQTKVLQPDFCRSWHAVGSALCYSSCRHKLRERMSNVLLKKNVGRL